MLPVREKVNTFNNTITAKNNYKNYQQNHRLLNIKRRNLKNKNEH